VTRSLRTWSCVVGALTLAIAAVGCGSSSGSSSSAPAKTKPATTATAAPVPAQYRSLYDQLQAQVTAINPGAPPSHPSTVYGTDLTVANSNLGSGLLRPNTMQKVQQQLDIFQKLGIQGVTIQINYPILDPAFPDQSQYVAFYSQVAQAIHQRGMIITIETNEILVGTAYTSVKWSYAGLTLPSYASAKAAMAQTLITTMTPKYLALETEGDTAAHATGLPLNDPATYASVVAMELAQLGPHVGTLVGAGPGSWQPTTFATELAKLPGLDFIDTHIYPTNATAIANASATAQIAHQAGKQSVMDEAWLYKGTGSAPGGAGAAANLQAHQLSYFSFFAPLDQQFLTKLAALTRADGFAYVSANQSFALSAYLTYEDSMATQSSAQITQEFNAVVSPALEAGTVSDTGRTYQQLIAG
jgi:hypothetical protein